MTQSHLFHELDFTKENVLAWAEERVLDEPIVQVDGKDAANTVERVLQKILGDHYVREWSEYSKSELLELVYEYAMHGTQIIDEMNVDALLTEIVSVCSEAYEFETMDDFVRNFSGED